MLSSPIEEIKGRLDIVEVVQSYIKLQKAGANYRALCPFHSDKNPSLFISPARQIWRCFGCNVGGDVFKFVMQIEGVEFGDALRTLAQRAGVELKHQDPQLQTERQRLFEMCELAVRFYETQLAESAAGVAAKEYLLGRGVSKESIAQWRLGYAPDSWQRISDFLVGKGYQREEIERVGLALRSERGGGFYDRFRGRIIFPVFNMNSQVIGFGGRVFKAAKRPDGQEEAKYINTSNTLLYDKGRVLYGLNKAAVEMRRSDACILVEGYMDVILVSQTGTRNVVATSGTALTPHQLQILKRYSENLYIAYDMDVAGDSATKRGIDLAQGLGFNIKIVTMPQDQDPADIAAQDSVQWEACVKNAKSIHDFYFENALAKFDKGTMEGKQGIQKMLLPIIKRIPNKIEQALWTQNLAKVLGVREEDVIEELKKVKIDQREVSLSASVEKIVSLQKTRKELLEERLVVLLLKLPQHIQLVQKEDIGIFSVPFSQIVMYMKDKGVHFGGELPDEHKELVQHLTLKAETEEIVELVELEKELKRCFKELKSLVIRNKLDVISREIRSAESANDFENVQKLMEEFRKQSRSLRNLETIS